MLDDSVFNFINDYSKKDIYPFHMPGHKRNKLFFKDIDFLNFDITEFIGSDNLHAPSSIILNSQKKASKLFGSKESFFIVNGSSAGLITGILSTVSENDKIIIARNCHKSVFAGLSLSKATPVYVYPEILENGLVGGINPLHIENLILNDKSNQIKAVVITSPTYDGFTSDIKSISEITNKYNKILIIDEAHGAHFNFSKSFPKSSVHYADLIVQSLHKTLPCFGQSSILHCNSKNIDLSRIKKNLSIMQTTSPSYLLLSMMDKFLLDVENNENYFVEFLNLLRKYRNEFKNLKNIKLIDNEIINHKSIFDFDISKLTFVINDSKLNGKEIEKQLFEKYSIQIEFSNINYFQALTSVCDTEKGFSRLLNALTEIDKTLDGTKKTFIYSFPKTTIVLNSNEINNLKTENTNLSKSLNKISAESIIPYPPGIPLLNPGELITNEIINHINILKNNNINFIGQEDTDLNFIKTFLNR